MMERMHVNPAINEPSVGVESSFKGVVLLLEEKAIIWKGDETGAKYEMVDVPEEMKPQVKKYRDILVEQISEHDDKLLEKFLAGVMPTVLEVKQALRKAALAYKLGPPYCG